MGAMGSGMGNRDLQIDGLLFKTRRFAQTVEREGLVDERTLRAIKRKAMTEEEFRKMFDKVRKVEAGKFADLVLGVGKSLEQALQEELTAKRLHAEQREGCPPKYRNVVSSYFEALSKAATEENQK